jgi:tetratricopeptide (TPR) repeat protein
MARKFLKSGVALAVVLSGGLGLAALPVTAIAKDKPAAPGKVEFSPAFAKAAADLDKTLSGAQSNPAVTAASEKARNAKTPTEKQAADAEVDAALGGAKAKLDAATAAASTPGDKLKAGDMTRILGSLFADPAMQHKGLVMMLDSGVAPPQSQGQIQYLAGVTAYQTGDYQGAIQYLKPSYDSGYRDQQGLIARVLEDSYKRTGNSQAALDMVQKDLAASKAAGTKPDESTVRTALQSAYDAKNLSTSADLCAELVRDYPSPDNWNTAIGVVRQLAGYTPSENVDLMRLMFRTNAMKDKHDYFEFLEDVDPRKQPGEALKVINQGISAGKITAADVKDYQQLAQSRVTADKASLPGLEKDAHNPSTSGALVIADGDAFLGYDQAAKAEEIYKLALNKADADKDRVHMRIGIAQADQGKYADAKASFAQVTGKTAPVAKLWTAYVDGKSAPASSGSQPAA